MGQDNSPNSLVGMFSNTDPLIRTYEEVSLMNIEQKIKELESPYKENSMKQIELMLKTDSEYKTLIESEILTRPERKVASCMELSMIYHRQI